MTPSIPFVVELSKPQHTGFHRFEYAFLNQSLKFTPNSRKF